MTPGPAQVPEQIVDEVRRIRVAVAVRREVAGPVEAAGHVRGPYRCDRRWKESARLASIIDPEV